MAGASLGGEVAGTLSRTRYAVGATVRRRDAGLVFAGVTVGYLLVYLFAIGDLGQTFGPGGAGLAVDTVADPFARMFQSEGYFSYEGVAVVTLGPVTYLFSPVNAAIGLGISLLVGLNLAVTYIAWTQPKACGLGASAGVFTGLPALLSGAACCGPVILIAFGIQASSLLIATFEALIPIAVALLVGSLLFVGRKVDPAVL